VVRRFRGGKGVATVAGGAVVLYPVLSVGFLFVFVVVAAVGRRPSVASLSVAALLPVGVAATGRPGWEVAVAAGLAVLVIARHAGNIRRLARGEEQAIRG
ncbi:MAG: glycerol-3-phosphate acyltransferase, partial [Acidimicrobiales bacterium]|nr:glycerol-3-phosphate acyltransferase [Acidimicrobiales bacterium]